ncbi:hypothetical protein VTL71DRAFT_3445 [Oculimacula yallundae]|uniref:Uncharacterized protein n=1 Tax=Oculimacula yallundae TaxID=86028 RepID=A0ABR4C768_9HELO
MSRFGRISDLQVLQEFRVLGSLGALQLTISDGSPGPPKMASAVASDYRLSGYSGRNNSEPRETEDQAHQKLREMLVQHMEDQDDTFEETAAWKLVTNMCNGRQSGLEYLTIRYVGTCSSPKRPLDRFREDTALRSGGILTEFSRAVEQLFPKIANAVEIFAFEKRPCQRYPSTVRMIWNEEADSIPIISPVLQIIILFQGLQTTFYTRFITNTVLPEIHTQGKLFMHFSSIQEYANSNPEETGTLKFPSTDGVRDIALRQGVPKQWDGYTIFVFFENEITLDEYLTERAFISGKSRADLLTRDFLRRLARSEAERAHSAFAEVSFDPAYFCFYDLWKWPKRKTGRQVIQFSLDYMRIVRPLIIVSYSRPVTGIATANFVHQFGIPPTSFTETVGCLTIHWYSEADRGTAGETDGDDAFICIPHIHPGRNKYGAQDVALRRVLDMTLQLTILVGDVALEVVDPSANPQFQTREKLCREILRRVDLIMATTPHGKRFASQFKRAKEDLREVFSRSTCRMSSEDVRPIMNHAGQLRMAEMGEAAGIPDSTERRDQLEILWNLNIANLHLKIPHEQEKKELWIADFMSLQTSQ